MDTLGAMVDSYRPEWTRSHWSGPQLKLVWPPSSFFTFPPSADPIALPPPSRDAGLVHPFNIPADIYWAALEPAVPVTVALVYASLITYLNAVNQRRNHKPWAVSSTSVFKLLVLLHNVLLSAYSAWTFVGMVNALHRTVPSVTEYGPAGVVDSLCKIHGPRGLGSSATYDSLASRWGIENKIYHLSRDLLPDSTDVGRIWNEGLAFYGWLFYLSKFYEVIDTLIIIAKGKKSSFLQTYHHAGAMLCMWAGIRYMSPPIWMFVLVNSFIHTLMYAFYFFTAIGIKIPKPLKQTLTTLQITQFVVGASYAFLHFFVAYQIPVKTPYLYRIGEKAVSGIASVVSALPSDASSALSAATAAANPASWAKKLALRAAGREGLAQNIEDDLARAMRAGVASLSSTAHGSQSTNLASAAQDLFLKEQTRFREELRWVNCLDTSGQAFAIYLNVFYLLPLTMLFVQFFIRSYIKRQGVEKRRHSLGQRAVLVGESFGDARKGVGRRVSEAFEDYQGANGDPHDRPVVVDGERIRKELKEMAGKGRRVARDAVAEGEEAVARAGESVQNVDVERIRHRLSDELREMQRNLVATVENIHETAVGTSNEDITEIVKQTANQTVSKASEVAERAQQSISQTDTMSSVKSSVRKKVEKNISQETQDSISETLTAGVRQAGNFGPSVAEDVHQKAEQTETRISRMETSSSSKSESTWQSSSSISRQAQDRVIDESELLREEVINTATGEASTTASDSFSAAVASGHIEEGMGSTVLVDKEDAEVVIGGSDEPAAQTPEKKEAPLMIDTQSVTAPSSSPPASAPLSSLAPSSTSTREQSPSSPTTSTSASIISSVPSLIPRPSKARSKSRETRSESPSKIPVRRPSPPKSTLSATSAVVAASSTAVAATTASTEPTSMRQQASKSHSKKTKSRPKAKPMPRSRTPTPPESEAQINALRESGLIFPSINYGSPVLDNDSTRTSSASGGESALNRGSDDDDNNNQSDSSDDEDYDEFSQTRPDSPSKRLANPTLNPAWHSRRRGRAGEGGSSPDPSPS